MAREESVKMVTSTGRAVIINDDLELAKKRALDDALYLASLQGGAKIDGYSSVDNKTNLRENLLVRSASEIIDFNIINEKKTKTHYNITIEAALLFKGQDIKCKENRKVNLSYLKPYFVVSSKVPAWANKLPSIISQHIFDNLSDLDDIQLMNKTNFLVNPKEQFNKSMSLDYDSIVEKPVIIKNGEFSIIPFIKISAANSRLHRFSKELDVEITVNLYKGPNYQKVDNLDYKFTLMLGNETGFPVIDSFYKVPMDKFLNYLRLSVSKFHLRILDQLKCMPLETEIAYTNQQLVAPLGTNQGLNNGTIGIVSNSNPNNSMKDWLVVSVIDSNPDYSILEMLNPNREMSDLDGKIIRFLD